MSTNNKDPAPLHRRQAQDPAPSARPTYEVRQLMGEAREVILVHQGEPYRLRVTANDKLILTK